MFEAESPIGVLARAECSAWEVEAGGSGQDHPWLQREFKTSLGYVRSCLKNKKYYYYFYFFFIEREREKEGGKKRKEEADR